MGIKSILLSSQYINVVPRNFHFNGDYLINVPPKAISVAVMNFIRYYIFGKIRFEAIKNFNLTEANCFQELTAIFNHIMLIS